MNKTAIITGVSRGLGKALVETFLAENYKVIGIGRSSDIQDSGYIFCKLDLSDWQAVEDFQLPTLEGEITLINNAGVLGNVGRISEMETDFSGEVMQVNVTAPIQLTRKVSHICENRLPFNLVNISSGAGKRPIPSWAAYCASKAALDMFSQTFFLEEQELGRNTKVYSVAPGVIDTDMQQLIRAANENAFSSLENFKKLKENNELESPSRISAKLLKMLRLPFDGNILYSLRDIDA